MKKFTLHYKLSALLLLVMLSSSFSQAQQFPDFTILVEKASPAVVNISTVRNNTQRFTGNQPQAPNQGQVPEIFKDFFAPKSPQQPSQPPQQRRAPQAQSTGSGFLISADGYILTNDHVVKGAEKIIVALGDRREMEAELVGSDPRSDLALLKIDAQGLPFLTMADSDKLKVGEWVLAIGSPFGFDYSVTAGIVSAKGRGLRSETYVPFIQTDVAINPGNSGGPLFNLDGEVVGINSQIYTRSGGFMGVSFAIPSNTASTVAKQLRETGQVARGWLGVQIQEVSQDLAESFGLDKASGALISQVLDDSPAFAAGLQTGDVITKIDGNDVVMSAQVAHFVGAIVPQSTAVIKVIRDGELIDVDVLIGHLPKNKLSALGKVDKSRYVERIGVRVASLAPEKAQEWRIRNGVDVREVDAGVAQELGLQVGDVITSIANQRIASVEQFASLAKALPNNRSISLRIVRQGMPLFVAFRLND